MTKQSDLLGLTGTGGRGWNNLGYSARKWYDDSWLTPRPIIIFLNVWSDGDIAGVSAATNWEVDTVGGFVDNDYNVVSTEFTCSRYDETTNFNPTFDILQGEGTFDATGNWDVGSSWSIGTGEVTFTSGTDYLSFPNSATYSEGEVGIFEYGYCNFKVEGTCNTFTGTSVDVYIAEELVGQITGTGAFSFELLSDSRKKLRRSYDLEFRPISMTTCTMDNITVKLASSTYKRAVRDIHNFIRWIKINNPFGYWDTTKIAIMGGSAGSNISGLVARTANNPDLQGELFLYDGLTKVSSQVQALINMFGTYDFTYPPHNEFVTENDFGGTVTWATTNPGGNPGDGYPLHNIQTGGWYDQEPANISKWANMDWTTSTDRLNYIEGKLRSISPITYLCDYDIPTLTLYGADDETNHPNQRFRVDQKMTEYEQTHYGIEFSGVAHSAADIMDATVEADVGTGSASRTGIEHCIEFLDNVFS